MKKIKHNLSVKEILKFITLINDLFEPKLSSTLNLNDYARKLNDNAYIVYERDDNDNLIGLCAFYVNYKSKTSYLSLIAIHESYQHKSIGSILLNKMECLLFELNIFKIDLEVYSNNKSAINFYLNKGYELKDKNGSSLFFSKHLEVS